MPLRPSMIARSFAGLLAASAASAVWAAPTLVNTGAGNVTIGTYSGSGTPTYTADHTVGPSVVTTPNGLFAFAEASGTTSLNPYSGGETFAFAFGSLPNANGLTATLTGFGNYAVQVEACDPIAFSNSGTCGSSPGSVSRQSLSNGDTSLTFNDMSQTYGTIDGYSGYLSDVYVIFTNAASDPPGPTACVSPASGGTLACFPSLGPSGGVVGTTVPEPAALGLLGVGMLGVMLRRRRAA